MDNLNRAIQAANTNRDFDGLNKGVEMVSKQFSRELKNNNVEIVDTKDRKFDPKTDEVFLTEETDDPEMDNMIVQELEPGYIFKDKLIKAAKVKVAHLKTWMLCLVREQAAFFITFSNEPTRLLWSSWSFKKR